MGVEVEEEVEQKGVEDRGEELAISLGPSPLFEECGLGTQAVWNLKRLHSFRCAPNRVIIRLR